MSEFAPLDVITMSNNDELWPPLVVLVRDWRKQPGWICINSKTAQIERVYDCIAYQYRKTGRVGEPRSAVRTAQLQRLLSEAVW